MVPDEWMRDRRERRERILTGEIAEFGRGERPKSGEFTRADRERLFARPARYLDERRVLRAAAADQTAGEGRQRRATAGKRAAPELITAARTRSELRR